MRLAPLRQALTNRLSAAFGSVDPAACRRTTSCALRVAPLALAALTVAAQVQQAPATPPAPATTSAPAPATIGDTQTSTVPPKAGSAAKQQQADAVAREQARAADHAQKEADAIERGKAKAAERAQKDKEKADAKARKDADKAAREAEKDATFLKLQDNEIVATTFDEQGNPVKLPPCARKDKACQTKRKELLKRKKVTLKVDNGTLTVDGWTGKARLNYDVANLQYIYFSVPGYGTIIASPDRFPNSAEMKDSLDGKTLTVTTADKHTVQLGSDVPISGKQKRSMFYAVDANYTQPGRFPSVGYGYVNKPPYAWPGTLPLTEAEKKRMAKAPVLPKGMEAREMTLPCVNVAPGEQPKAIKVNGVMMFPPVCKTPSTATLKPGERPLDGSGAASNGIAEDHTRH